MGNPPVGPLPDWDSTSHISTMKKIPEILGWHPNLEWLVWETPSDWPVDHEYDPDYTVEDLLVWINNNLPVGTDWSFGGKPGNYWFKLGLLTTDQHGTLLYALELAVRAIDNQLGNDVLSN